MRVCQPGPVAFQRSMTSMGRRMEISLRGFAERGRPPLFTTARANDSSVSSGKSLYSCARTTWASTLVRSDFKVRREAGFLTVIGLSHAENVSSCTSYGVADYNQASGEQAVADDPTLSVALARVFDFNCRAVENDGRIFEIQSSIRERTRPLRRIVGNTHWLL